MAYLNRLPQLSRIAQSSRNDDFIPIVELKDFDALMAEIVKKFQSTNSADSAEAANIASKLKDIEYNKISFNTVLGALTRYISHTGLNSFAPMNANYGLIYRANSMDKKVVADRSLLEVKKFIKQINE